MESDWPETEAELAALRKRVKELEEIDESTAKQLTEHAEAAGVDPDHIDYIDETTKAIVAMWAKNSELEARIKELERENSELDLAAMCNADAAKMAEMERDELKAKVERVTTENTHLRAALATSKDPCIYCQLPAEEMGKCKRGFPGCARADDLSGCPEFGAAMELHDTQARVDDLAMVAISLVRALRKSCPGSDAERAAMDYLERHKLFGSPLR